MKRLDFSVAAEPAVFVRCGGWSETARATFAARVAGIAGVRSVLSAAGDAAYVFYRAEAIAEDQLCQALARLADELVPGHGWSAGGTATPHRSARGFNYRDSSSGRFTTRDKAASSPATHERERR